ncbi:MAG: deoxynucleoside kinase [Lactobacillaceae bacterium]|jgi:deoxyadenosine/deoxycytidine kinase|nr:deoxynucleoside kinase [Lactobacillaceae bacterium]
MIVLAGTIGAGKTSLTDLISKKYNSTAYYESVEDNPILPLFYEDPNKYGFLLQIYFMNWRMEQIKAAQKNKLDVIDRSIYEDSLMFQMNADLGRATQTEVDIHKSLLDNMMETLVGVPAKDPDLLIHIKVSLDTMLSRISKRGRDYEQDPSLYDYYKTLNDRYVEFYENYDRGPKLQIDGDVYDFVDSSDAAQRVMEMIDNKLKEIGIA